MLLPLIAGAHLHATRTLYGRCTEGHKPVDYLGCRKHYSLCSNAQQHAMCAPSDQFTEMKLKVNEFGPHF